MNAYSLDLRLKVLDAVDRGIPRKEEEVVGTFGVSMPTLERYLRRRRARGWIQEELLGLPRLHGLFAFKPRRLLSLHGYEPRAQSSTDDAKQEQAPQLRST